MNKLFTGIFVSALLALPGLVFGADVNKTAAKQPTAQEKALWDKITSGNQELDKFQREKIPKPPAGPDVNEAAIKKYEKEFEAFKKDFLKQVIPLFDDTKEYYNKYPKGSFAGENMRLLFILLTNVTFLSDGILAPADEQLYERLCKDENLTADTAGELFWVNLIRVSRLMDTPKDNNEPDKKAVEALLDKIQIQINDFGRRFKSQGFLLQGEVKLADAVEKLFPRRSIQILTDAKKYASEEVAKRLDGLIRNKSVLGTRPEIKFKAVDGNEVDLSKLKGKVVLIDFWATWCPPCIEELPKVIDTYKKYHSKGFEIIGISFDKDIEAVKKFVKEKGMTWPQYSDGKFWDNDWGVYFGIQQIPTMWLVDKDGKVVDAELQGSELEAKVAKLLGVEK